MHFFAKKFAYIKKMQYLCTRNRKDMYYGLASVSGDKQRRGATYQGIAEAKTHTHGGGMKSREPFRFRASCFSLS